MGIYLDVDSMATKAAVPNNPSEVTLENSRDVIIVRGWNLKKMKNINKCKVYLISVTK